MNTHNLFNSLIILTLLLPTLLTGSPIPTQAAPAPPYALNGAEATEPGMSLSGLSEFNGSAVQSQPAVLRWALA